MKLTISKDANINYLAKIVKVDSFRPHPNAERLKLATVDGYVISTDIDNPEGLYVYFPVECVINSDFLKKNNLYRKSELNKDSDKTGFFEEQGRVKCIKLRGLASEGLIMPVSSLCTWSSDLLDLEHIEGTEFDTVNGIKFVEKYVVKSAGSRRIVTSTKATKNKMQIVDEQFHYHVDTIQLQRAVTNVNPDDIINISWKEHGSSVILCNLLTKRKLSLKEKIAKLFKVSVVETEYKKFCSSRRVIKDPDLNPNLGVGYYDYDIWNIAFEVVKDIIPKGISLYGEIVGYMQNGGMIQKDYDYGCIYDPKVYDYAKMTPTQMYNSKLFDIIIYRITYTNVEGRVFEFSTQQMKEFCSKYGLHTITELYYGYAKDLFPEIAVNGHWHENFLNALRDKYLERQSVLCKNNVPEEGIVLRREISDIDVYKLKSQSFLLCETKMLDKGEIDIESSQE